MTAAELDTLKQSAHNLRARAAKLPPESERAKTMLDESAELEKQLTADSKKAKPDA